MFICPTAANAVPDTDQDGISDGQESDDGTDPNDPDRVLDHHGTEYFEDWNWTSAEFSVAPAVTAFFMDFASGGGGFQSIVTKDELAGVRCARALTL